MVRIEKDGICKIVIVNTSTSVDENNRMMKDELM